MYPHEHIDTTDKRYINYSFYPVASPFKNILQIDIYNDKLFWIELRVYSRLNDTPINSINCADFEPHKDMLTAKNHSKFRVMM